MLKHIKNILLFTYICLSTVFFSCENRIGFNDEDLTPTTPVGNRTSEQRLKDSIYYYYKLYSLWETSIPVYKPISVFTDPLSTRQQVLTQLMSMTPVYVPYSATGGTYDRFSYFSNSGGGFSSSLSMDWNSGFGLFFSFGAINDTEAYPIIYMVEGGSPASVAGLRRGDVVKELNSVSVKIPIVCNGGSCNAVDASQMSAIRSDLVNALSSSQMMLQVEKPDEQIKNVTLVSNSYEIDPLLADTVFEFSNMNVGYFAYSSFEEIENNNRNQRKIDDLFDKFESKNIKSLIVDLRYNGGGYVDAATYIADKIINSAGKNKLMLKYEVNAYLERSKSQPNSTFKDLNFTKTSDLELGKVCFIVSDRTASASEMLINVLKPYMDVKVIAEENSTYGKPVGFFPTRIMNSIVLWVTSFKLLNANNQGDYWTGLHVDRSNVQDYIFDDFGVKEEKMIEAALSFTGAANNVARLRGLNVPVSRGGIKMDDVNTVDYKGALKK